MWRELLMTDKWIDDILNKKSLLTEKDINDAKVIGKYLSMKKSKNIKVRVTTTIKKKDGTVTTTKTEGTVSNPLTGQIMFPLYPTNHPINMSYSTQKKKQK